MLVVPRKFPYNASYKKMTLAIVVCILAGAILTQAASTNDRGLSIDYIINFDTNGATIFYWVLVGICVIGCVIAVAAMVGRRVSPKELKIDDNQIIIPHGFLLSKTRAINYSDLTDITETQISRQNFLYLHTPSGKTALMESLLPDKDDYEDIKQFLVQKLR